MAGRPIDGRRFRPEVTARADVGDDGRIEVRAPAVGVWREAPPDGTLITPGSPLGQLEVLGVLHLLRAPAGAQGLVVERSADAGASRVPVAWGERLLRLDPEAAGTMDAAEARAQIEGKGAAAGLAFPAPTSGRFYRGPAPDEEPFVSEGDEITAGQTIGLIEVMKTFNRVTYQPDPALGLPERVRIVRIVPEDGGDVDGGEPLLELETVGGAGSMP